MNLNQIALEGTIKPDGTLELDTKPNLPPGRVQVIVKPLGAAVAPASGLAEVILQIQQDQKARGFVGLSAQDLAAEQKARQEEADDYERRCEDLGLQTQSGPLK